MITTRTISSSREIRESVIFQPVLKAYPTCHSWIISAHVSLYHLECCWKVFTRQLLRTCQLIQFLSHQASAPTQLASALEWEFTNIEDIYNAYQPTIISAMRLLNTNPSFNSQPQTHIWNKWSLLPFFGDALKFLMGTATTKDINTIKTRINQLIATQSSQQGTLVHIVSVLNVTCYTTQINCQNINILMDKLAMTSHDINNLYNLTTSLATSISFHQLVLLMQSILTNLHYSLHYIKTVSTHAMDYIDAATSGTLSPHILPMLDLQIMLTHVQDILPSTLHLPISPEDNLHLYRFLCTYVLITNQQFLLLIDIPIQDRSQEVTIYEVFTLHVPHGNFSAGYDIDTKYLGITSDETMAMALSTSQFKTCQAANSQFCSMSTPLQPLANPLTCVSALYAKNSVHISLHCSIQIWKPAKVTMPIQIAPNVWIITTSPSAPQYTLTQVCPREPTHLINVRRPIHTHTLELPTACSITSPYFYLPPTYHNPHWAVNISLLSANIHMLKISSSDFHV